MNDPAILGIGPLLGSTLTIWTTFPLTSFVVNILPCEWFCHPWCEPTPGVQPVPDRQPSLPSPLSEGRGPSPRHRDRSSLSLTLTVNYHHLLLPPVTLAQTQMSLWNFFFYSPLCLIHMDSRRKRVGTVWGAGDLDFVLQRVVWFFVISSGISSVEHFCTSAIASQPALTHLQI